MKWFKTKIKVVTHDGTFHADDVFASAALYLWAEKSSKRIEIKRSRDEAEIKKADIVVDVGMQYDPSMCRFDHHQKGGAGVHDNGVPYASFGLIWKHYGDFICGNLEVAKMIEQRLVIPIDARDNGIRVSLPNEKEILDHRTSDMISNFNMTWLENYNDTGRQFKKSVIFAKEIILREIATSYAESEGIKLTKEAIRNQNNPEILILDKYVDWGKAVSMSVGVKLVVYQHKNGHDWCVQSGRDDLEDYNSDRANLPKEWGGLRDLDLEQVSGIKGASFCINGGWFGTSRTKEGAIAMAKKALQE